MVTAQVLDNAFNGYPRLILRVDASSTIGLGHFIRCMALAQAWCENGGAGLILSCECPSSLLVTHDKNIAFRSLDVVPGSNDDAFATVGLAKHIEASCVVVDGGRFRSGYREIISREGLKVLMIDDTGLDASHANVVLNQNLHAASEMYPGHPKLLLGPRYALLRRCFWPSKAQQRVDKDKGCRLLVLFGGSDPVKLTERFIDLAPKLPLSFNEIVIVVGGGNPRLQEILLRQMESRIIVKYNITDMASEIAQADLVVSSAGSTIWELCSLSTPMVLVAALDMEVASAKLMAEMGAAIYVGAGADIDDDSLLSAIVDMASDHVRRKELGFRAGQVVDGAGALRVCSYIRQECNLDPITADDPIRSQTALRRLPFF